MCFHSATRHRPPPACDSPQVNGRVRPTQESSDESEPPGRPQGASPEGSGFLESSSPRAGDVSDDLIQGLFGRHANPQQIEEVVRILRFLRSSGFEPIALLRDAAVNEGALCRSAEETLKEAGAIALESPSIREEIRRTQRMALAGDQEARDHLERIARALSLETKKGRSERQEASFERRSGLLKDAKGLEKQLWMLTLLSSPPGERMALRDEYGPSNERQREYEEGLEQRFPGILATIEEFKSRRGKRGPLALNQIAMAYVCRREGVSDYEVRSMKESIKRSLRAQRAKKTPRKKT
jgi:hypothetical protein